MNLVRNILPPYKQWPYLARFFTIVLVGILFNMAGLAATQLAGWSILFFDMTGTAFASLLGGAAAGLIVASITGGLGAALIDPHYYIFSAVNVVGALLWAILPRLGRPGLGGELFDPQSYRRGMVNIVSIGLVVGTACSAFAFVIQAYVLNLKSYLQGANGPDILAGTETSANNVAMIRGLVSMFPESHVPYDVTIALAVFASNIPDKIIATATAVLLVFIFGTLPNYKNQRAEMRNRPEIPPSGWVDNKLFLLTVCFFPAITIPVMTWNITRNATSTGIMLVCLLFAFVAIINHVYLRSFDRDLDDAQPGSRKLFYGLPGHELKCPREVFEDILKIMVVVVSALGFFIAGFAHDPKFCHAEDLGTLIDCGMLYRLVVINILILTGYRYVLVLLIRMIGRV